MTPLTSQFTSVLLKFVMVAVNCTVPLTLTVPYSPVTEIVGVAAVELPQEFNAASAGSSAKNRNKRCQRAFRR